MAECDIDLAFSHFGDSKGRLLISKIIPSERG